MSASDIVSVTITSQSAAISQAGFGIPLILSCEANSKFPERARRYTDIADVAADGFATTGMTYLQAQAALSQSPHVEQIIIGRRANLPTMAVTLTPVVKNSTKYIIEVDGVIFDTFTSDANATAAEIVTGLSALINASPIAVTATGTTTLILTADAAGYIFKLYVDRQLMTQANGTTDPGIVADLNAIRTALDGADDWYMVQVDSKGKAEAVALAAAIEAVSRQFAISSSDDDILTGSTSDLLSTLKTAGYKNTFGIYHPKNYQHNDTAWVSRVSPLVPGSETWNFKDVSGVDTVALSATEKTNLIGKNGNYNRAEFGRRFMFNGKNAAGGKIDTIRLNHWTEARSIEQVFVTLVSQPGKVPYDDKGISMVQAALLGVLNEGASNGGFIRSSIKVSVPKVADVSAIDRSNRQLRNVKGEAQYTSAIESTTLVINLYF